MGFFAANWKWLLSGTALVLFVIVQHSLYLSLLRACRKFKDALDSNDPQSDAGSFVWLRDVRAMFSKPDGAWGDNSPLPREAVIDALDNEVWRRSHYAALQRWGLAAPLIGVILSAVGFMFAPPELTGAVGDVMTKLGPLFVGVFVGALMALINQVYLHYAALELGKVRASAVRWFDDVIWRTIRQNAHNVLGRAAAETQNAAKSLENSSQQLATCNVTYRDSLLELNRQIADVRGAALSSFQSFETLSASISEMTQRLGASIKNVNALNDTAAAIENASVVWNIAAAKVITASAAIDESSKKFHDTCGNFATNFEEVRNAMKEGMSESTGNLREVVNGLAEPLKNLGGSIEQMKANTDRHTELATALTSAVEHSNQFLAERMALNIDEADMQQEMATRTRAAIESLQKLTDTVNTVGGTSTSLNAAAGGLREASMTIGSALKNFLDTCATMNHGATEVSHELQGAARELAQPVRMLSTNLSRVSNGAENQAEIVERLDHVARQSERAEVVRAERMEQIEQRLGETAQALSESAKGMAQLQQGLEALVSEIRAARDSKEPAPRRWLPWLSSRAGRS